MNFPFAGCSMPTAFIIGIANKISQWPLERQPVYFATQIEKFAEVVATHLKMRSLAPAFTISPDYTLKAKEGSEEEVCRWFDEVSLNCTLCP